MEVVIAWRGLQNRGQRGERQRYREGQEDQLGALGLVVNIIVLWNIYYLEAAFDHLGSSGFEVNPIDVTRVSPLKHKDIDMLGRYHFSVPNYVHQGELRPLRNLSKSFYFDE